jgi:hypothetical protein
MRKVQFLMFFHDFWEYELVPLVLSQVFLIDFRLSIDYFCEFFRFIW